MRVTIVPLLASFLLLVCSSLQHGNVTSSGCSSPIASVTGNAGVLVTLNAYLPGVSLSTTELPRLSNSTDLVIPHSIITSYQQDFLPTIGHSNSSVVDIESTLNNTSFESGRSFPDDVTVESTAQAANTNHSRASRFPQSNHINLPIRNTVNQTAQPNDGSPPGSDIYPQNDISSRWIASLRRERTNNDSKRKRYLREDDGLPRKRQLWTADQDSPFELSKVKLTPKVGFAALATGALLLTTLDLEKRKRGTKSRKNQEKTPSTGPRQPNHINSPPEKPPISTEQLVGEVKAIYSHLLMVEAQCIEFDRNQALLISYNSALIPSNEQWESAIELHRTLLDDHCDFFQAIQHPSATLVLRRLASRRSMPARMWRHAIHDFLELLRQRLPASLDHMEAFIHLSYSTLTLLYETVPAFEDIWTECLGDLGRYRMALEDKDIQDKEIWMSVAEQWYMKGSNTATTTGRLYHRLASLDHNNALKQLFYHSKSICVAIPYAYARQSILTFFHTVLDGESANNGLGVPPYDMAFIRAHELLFTNTPDRFESYTQEFVGPLDSKIAQITSKFMEDGYHIAIANTTAMLGFGSKDNPLMTTIRPSLEHGDNIEGYPMGNHSFRGARKISYATLNVVLQRLNDPNVLPCIHVSLAFMHSMYRHPRTHRLVDIEFPWLLLAAFLNNLLDVCDGPDDIIKSKSFPRQERVKNYPFPEDFAIRGLVWAEEYFPSQWFCGDIEDNERSKVLDMTALRSERILWLAVRIAKRSASPLKYESVSYNPCEGEFNKARFYPSLDLLPFDCSSSSIDTPGTFSEKNASPSSCSNPDLERRISRGSLDDDPLLHGMNATLSVPMVTAQVVPKGESKISQPGLEGHGQTYFTKQFQTLEDWLSDWVNFDIASDECKEFREEQAEIIPDSHVPDVAGKSIPSFEGVTTTHLLVLAHTRNGFDNSKHPKDSPETNQESYSRGNQVTKEEKSQFLPSLPAMSYNNTRPFTSLSTPPQADETLPSEPPSSMTLSNSLPAQQESSNSDSPKPRTCPHCNKAFARLSDMNKHIKYHTKPFSCPVPGCKYSCGRQRDLVRHEEGFHKVIFGGQEFPCRFKECEKLGRKFSREDNLLRHLRRRHGGS